MMSGQNGSRQVIEAVLACLAQVSLSASFAIVMTVADHASVTAVKADNTVRPSQLTNDFIALRFVEQVRQLDQVHHGSRSLPPQSDQRINVPIRTNTQRFCLVRTVRYQAKGFSSPRNSTRAGGLRRGVAPGRSPELLAGEGVGDH